MNTNREAFRKKENRINVIAKSRYITIYTKLTLLL